MNATTFRPAWCRKIPAIAITCMVVLSPLLPGAPAGAATATTKVAAKTGKTRNPLPVLNVTDVRSAKPYALASAFDGKKPLLVWFWAPN